MFRLALASLLARSDSLNMTRCSGSLTTRLRTKKPKWPTFREILNRRAGGMQQRSRPLTFAQAWREDSGSNEGFGSGWCIEWGRALWRRRTFDKGSWLLAQFATHAARRAASAPAWPTRVTFTEAHRSGSPRLLLTKTAIKWGVACAAPYFHR